MCVCVRACACVCCIYRVKLFSITDIKSFRFNSFY